MDDARLAELLGGLSVATDWAAGLAAETALTTSVIATRVARAAGVQGFELRDVYYAGLLRFIGCTAYAHETAPLGAGDDLRFLGAMTPIDPLRPVELLRAAAKGLEPTASLAAKVGAIGRLLRDPRGPERLATAHCDLAVRLASRLGMSEGVVETLGQAYERWDGRGAPARLRGDSIVRSARILHLAWRLAAHRKIDGPREALSVASVRAGTELDPALVARADDAGLELFQGLDEVSTWETFLATEPSPALRLPTARLPEIATAFAHYVDLKSPFTLGHSTGVAELARAAASRMSIGTGEDIFLAGLLHDLGCVAVPNGIWEAPGPLGPAQWDKVRDHAHHTERILSRTPLLKKVAAIASQAHERLDGSGYHRGLPAAAISVEARILAAADAYHARTEQRPHRPAVGAKQAAEAIREDARSGRLCRDAVDAVLTVAGHARPRARAATPGGLSEREIEVLKWVARGLSNKEIGRALFISPKTVQRHMEGIFEKTKVRTRAAAAVFAVEHDLV